MILREFTEKENADLSKIQEKILEIMKIEGDSSIVVHSYLTACVQWTSSRVVVFAAMVYGGLRQDLIHEREAFQAKEGLRKTSVEISEYLKKFKNQ